MLKTPKKATPKTIYSIFLLLMNYASPISLSFLLILLLIKQIAQIRKRTNTPAPISIHSGAFW